jgi:SAM-dependent methyltransferase
MTHLYTDLARVYHEMYQTLFDYKAEFNRYHRLLQKFHPCQSVLEVGCGSGNLAPFFRDAGYTYSGLDLNQEMLAIARELHPQATFIQADMRDFQVDEPYDAVIVSGRSFGYLIANQDVMQALACFHAALTGSGILILDSFDAETVIQKDYAPFTQEVDCNGRKVTRMNRRSLNLESGFTWNWDAEYLIEDEKGDTRTVHDHTVLRAFTESELRLFLRLSGFVVLDVNKENQMLITCQKQV